jgi:MFS-type transporter involved in bile tolerance (Atg22 family)
VLLSGYPPLWAVIVILTLFSLFLAIATVPYTALMPDITPSSQRGRVGGVTALFGMLGASLIIALAYVLWDSQRTLLFFIVAAGVLVTFAITLWTIKEPPPEPALPTSTSRRTVGAYIGDLLQRRELTKYLAATFFFWAGNGGITPFVTRFAVDVLRVEANLAFVLVLPAIVGAAIFAIPAGLAAEHYGKKKVLCAGMALFGLSALVGSLILGDVQQALAIMTLVGIANAITTTLMFPLLTDMIPRDRLGEFTGINALVGSLAQPIGALGAGFLADTTGTLRAAFAAGGLMMLVGFAILTSVRVPPTAQEERILLQGEAALPTAC